MHTSKYAYSTLVKARLWCHRKLGGMPHHNSISSFGFLLSVLLSHYVPIVIVIIRNMFFFFFFFLIFIEFALSICDTYVFMAAIGT